MENALWIAGGLSVLCWVISWAIFARLRPVPSLVDATSSPAISVIIPARNEERNLERLLASLRSSKSLLLEILVVDDQSEDRTSEVAKECGARVLAGTPPPDGWLGKPWACQQGAESAKGEWLLFLDADTEFERDGLAQLAGLAQRSDGVHSVCPYHRVKAPYEELSAFFNVIMILGMNAFTIKGSKARDIGLFGQVLLVSRRQYERVGGHHAVRGEVLENFHLARSFEMAGIARHCWLGKGCIRMRMFPGGVKDLEAGWSKGAVSGAGNTPRGAMIGISLWLSGLFMAAGPLAASPWAPEGSAVVGFLSGVYALWVLQLVYLFKRAGSFSIFSALFFPIGLVFYHVVFFRALIRKKSGGTVRWKGRHVG